jgi:U3 small nucleolar RNA-associated protein 13
MANRAAYHTTFEAQSVIQPIYTGGSVSLDQSGRILATCLGEDTIITDLENGKQLARIEGVHVLADLLRAELIEFRMAK